jgi:hypothetical protein
VAQDKPFPAEELRTVVRWIIEWAMAPGEAASGELQLHIIVPQQKTDEDEPQDNKAE